MYNVLSSGFVIIKSNSVEEAADGKCRESNVQIYVKSDEAKAVWQQTGESLRKGIETRRHLDYTPPLKVLTNLDVERLDYGNVPVYVLRPKGETPKRHLFYLHGGAYVHHITVTHWYFLQRIIEHFPCTITVPLYPLAPEHTYEETIATTEEILHDRFPDVIMGDSAGAGLALSLVQKLKENDQEQPDKTILISPWLDVSMTNTAIKKIESKDVFLATPGVKEAGRWYAGDLELDNPLISPAYGTSDFDSELTIFMGTHDILQPDVKKFVEKAEGEGKKVTYIEAKSMMHMYPMFTFKEAKKKGFSS